MPQKHLFDERFLYVHVFYLTIFWRTSVCACIQSSQPHD